MKNLGLALCEALVSEAAGILHHEIMHALAEAEHAGITSITRFNGGAHSIASDVVINNELKGFYT